MGNVGHYLAVSERLRGVATVGSLSDLAISRAQSMNNRAGGLMVRFFKVTIPTGVEWFDKSTARPRVRSGA
jgi:hypothetical protein